MKKTSKAIFTSVAVIILAFFVWSATQAKSIPILRTQPLITKSEPIIIILHKKVRQKKLSIFLREAKWPTKHTKEWHKANIVMRMYDMGIDPTDNKGNSDVERAMIAYMLGAAK